MECQVCVQKYKKKSPKITCEKCAYESCYDCIKTFATGKKTSQITCMNCREPWSDFLLFVNMPKSFHKLRNAWRLDESVDYEMSLMPETQRKIEFLQKYESIHDQVQIYEDEIQQLFRQVRQLKMLKIRAQNDMQLLKNTFSQGSAKNLGPGKPCPNGICRGFLNAELFCTLCHSKTCPTCFLAVDQTQGHHICQRENIDSVKLILQETKSCPKCAIPIIKSEGCDQIWCVHCHTAFNWHTQKIIVFNYSFHNPHYADWYKKTMNNRALLDNSVDVFLPIFFDKYKKILGDSFHRTFSQNVLYNRVKLNFENLIDSYRDLSLRNHPENRGWNETLRLDYLNHRVDKETFI